MSIDCLQEKKNSTEGTLCMEQIKCVGRENKNGMCDNVWRCGEAASVISRSKGKVSCQQERGLNTNEKVEKFSLLS